MIDVVNKQRKWKVDAGNWKNFATRALLAIKGTETSAVLVFVSDREMRRLNREFRGKEGTTDVLSFPGSSGESGFFPQECPGEVVISMPRAAAQAGQNGLTLTEEISQLVLHGLLHLSGYDHETDNGAMDALEIRLRRKLGVEGRPSSAR